MLDDNRDTDVFFLTRAYTMVDSHVMDPIMSWNQNGSSFISWNPIKLTGLVMFSCKFTSLLPLILFGYISFEFVCVKLFMVII